MVNKDVYNNAASAQHITMDYIH